MRFLKILICLCFSLCFCSCGGKLEEDINSNENFSSSQTITSSPDISDTSQLEDSYANESSSLAQTLDNQNSEHIEESFPKKVLMTEENVKLLGRTYIDEENLWCVMSGTGVEFNFTGKSLTMEIIADKSIEDVSIHRPRIGIYLNGELVVDEVLSKQQTSFTIFEGENVTTANIMVIKLSEGEMSTFAIKPLYLNSGEKISPAEKKPHSIEFIGDSITCGYGVETNSPNQSFSTSTENITKSFPYLASQLLDADYSVFAASGYGVLSGYTSDSSKLTSREIIPNYYETLGYCPFSLGGEIYSQDVSWDFSSFVPQVIVINLGTNDSTYCQNDKQKLRQFELEYISFLEQVRKNNPQAEIFCTLGTLSKQIWVQVKNAADEYCEKTGDARVHTLLIDTKDGELGYGADWHPSEATQNIIALALYEEIMDIMQW